MRWNKKTLRRLEDKYRKLSGVGFSHRESSSNKDKDLDKRQKRVLLGI